MNSKFLAVLLVFCAATMFAQDAPRGLSPVKPQQLLAAMPEAPEGWTLKMSKAANEVDDWLESHAQRVYEKPPQEEGERPSLVRIGILDTAKQGGGLATFEDFQSGPAGDATEGVFIDGMPAYRTKGEGYEQIEALVDGRFVLEILMRNPEEKSLKEWLGRIRVSVLRAAARDSREITYPDEILITEINQLDPAKNATYYLSKASEAETERQLLNEERLLEAIEKAAAEGKDIDELDLSEFE